jgi:hypothetical protein
MEEMLECIIVIFRLHTKSFVYYTIVLFRYILRCRFFNNQSLTGTNGKLWIFCFDRYDQAMVMAFFLSMLEMSRPTKIRCIQGKLWPITSWAEPGEVCAVITPLIFCFNRYDQAMVMTFFLSMLEISKTDEDKMYSRYAMADHEMSGAGGGMHSDHATWRRRPSRFLQQSCCKATMYYFYPCNGTTIFSSIITTMYVLTIQCTLMLQHS